MEDNVRERVEITKKEVVNVTNEIFHVYVDWRQPISSLTVEQSTLTEESVSEKITKSLKVNAGFEIKGVSASVEASIQKETEKSVKKAEGLKITTEYDLTKYEQDKLYRLILVGNYKVYEYTFQFYRTPLSWQPEVTGGKSVFERIDVDLNSFKVLLVHD